MDRLTREEIEAKHNAIAAAIALVEGMSQQFYDERWQAAADLRDLALQSIESVRSEALESVSYAELQAMYDAQCVCTDEWAAKYEAEKSKKASSTLLNRIAELKSNLANVNGRLSQCQIELRALSPARVAEGLPRGIAEDILEHEYRKREGLTSPESPARVAEGGEKKDAARYRWLRQANDQDWNKLMRDGGEQLDAAIDAAINDSALSEPGINRE